MIESIAAAVVAVLAALGAAGRYGVRRERGRRDAESAQSYRMTRDAVGRAIGDSRAALTGEAGCATAPRGDGLADSLRGAVLALEAALLRHHESPDAVGEAGRML